MKGYKKEESYDLETTNKLKENYSNIIENIGEDPNREGLLKTPERVAKAMQFLTQGYNTDGKQILESAIFSEDYNQMVLVKGIELYSLCEHHMLPFSGAVDIAYIPDGEVLGISKLARLVDMFARRLQIQERMTAEIACALQEHLIPKGVAVRILASHSCMTHRGTQKGGSVMESTHFTGEYKNDLGKRREFLEAVRRGDRSY